MTNLAKYRNFEAQALGVAEPLNTQFVPDTRSPALFVPFEFPYQSYFDSTLLQTAIRSQPKNAPIVAARHEGISGFSLGLHPSSETPIAVQFDTNGKSSGSTVYILKPGQTIKPQMDSFSGFTWGLPFGWLGGGLATLVVFPTKQAKVSWYDDNELCFHRARFPILQPADLTLAGTYNNAPKNWPMRFPWVNAFSNTVDQKGKPLIMMARPTKVILVLRGATTLASAAPMMAIFQSTNDFAVGSDGEIDTTSVPIFETITWPTWTSLGTSGNLATQNPLLVREQGIARLSADEGGLVFLDSGGAAALNGLYVDVARYGKL